MAFLINVVALKLLKYYLNYFCILFYILGPYFHKC